MHPHAQSLADVRAHFQSPADDHGLTAAEAASRLARHGPNSLPTAAPVTLGAIVLHQFLSPLIYILLAAAVVSAVLGDFVDALFILLIVTFNAALGAFQEYRAERSAEALQRLLTVHARVRRDGTERSIPAEQLVPGDIVLIESGNRVPADLRLLHVTGLEVDESFLTGESEAVYKHTEVVPADAAVADRRNMAFAGALVMSGRGTGLVTATGRETQVGAIAAQVSAGEATKAPLVLRMERFARQVSVAVLAACLVLAAVGIARGMGAVEVFFLAVALAVSAIPEGLPIAVTVALSIAARRMARRNVIVRRLTAVEGLGSCTIIASDKTGTLTVNRQTVRSVAIPDGPTLAVTGDGYNAEGQLEGAAGAGVSASDRALVERVAWAAMLCNEARLERVGDAWESDGDAVDIALLAFGRKLGLDPARVRGDAEIVAELPFESSRAFAATFVRRDGHVHVVVKGALERLLPRCAQMHTVDGVLPLDEAAAEAQLDLLTGEGQRVLAVAEGSCTGAPTLPLTDDALPPLTLLGLVGLMDPPREEARAAVQQCLDAGVQVAMVTGDHPRTALAIARELGFATEASEVVTGRELAEAGARTPAFDALVARGRVFARMAPLQKLEIVDALRRGGHFVAVTGDGVNDAPALKAANIGVAMGSGSDVTKDTASLIVTDDNFASIEAGVEEGRFAYDNIRKVTYLLISTGVAEVLLVLSGLVFGLPLPLLAVQLLWLNLVTNGIQEIGLAFEGGEPGAMRRPPRRPTEGIFNEQMIRQVLLSGVAMGAIAATYWAALIGMGIPADEARSPLLILFVLMQNVHVFNCRSEHVSAFRVPLSRNWVVVAGAVSAFGVHVLASYIPFFQRLLRIQPLRVEQWLTPLALALLVLALMEVYKWQKARRGLSVSAAA